ncbi:MAG: hypothetical protein K6A90_07250 [Lachnospiraceae bacterium]|nr:hypothetical protein [Lachnospiraceae bacterium]
MNLEEKEFIMQRITQSLDNRQMIKLMDTLDDVIKRSEDGILEKSSEELLDVLLGDFFTSMILSHQNLYFLPCSCYD